MQKTDEQFAEAIKKGIELAEKTGEFAIEQAPGLVQEFYKWELVSNSAGVLLGIFLFVVIYLFYKFAPHEEEDYYRTSYFGKQVPDYYAGLGYVLTLFCTIFGVGLISYSSYNLLFMWSAPKIYLIQKVSELL